MPNCRQKIEIRCNVTSWILRRFNTTNDMATVSLMFFHSIVFTFLKLHSHLPRLNFRSISIRSFWFGVLTLSRFRFYEFLCFQNHYTTLHSSLQCAEMPSFFEQCPISEWFYSDLCFLFGRPRVPCRRNCGTHEEHRRGLKPTATAISGTGIFVLMRSHTSWFLRISITTMSISLSRVRYFYWSRISS